MNELVTATDLAKACGLSRQAIYLYEDKGLIEPAQTLGKYRLYSKDTVELINKIQSLKKDYHLPKIKEMIDEGVI
jgi:DNA-binding transcriptional MerR regulator